MIAYHAAGPDVISSKKMQPALKQDCYQILDVVRGFALIGIVVANMVLYSLYVYLPAEKTQAFETYSTDKVFDFLELFFVEGKFYTIFSVLFGIGFSILLTRASQKGLIFYRFFLRRIFFLYLIGCAHAILVWHDDILQAYAVCGALLLFFIRMKNRTILILSAIVLLSPILIHLAGGLHPTIFGQIRNDLFQRFGFSKDTIVHTWATGSYGEIILLNFSKLFDQNEFFNFKQHDLFYLWKVSIGFLSGQE